MMPRRCIGNLEIRLQLDLSGQINAQDVLLAGKELLYRLNRRLGGLGKRCWPG
jgi:hypothetical protein